MGDYYQLNGDFSESSIQELVTRFRQFLYECSIRVDPTCIKTYGSGRVFNDGALMTVRLTAIHLDNRIFYIYVKST